VSDVLVATCAWALVVGRVCYVYYQLEIFSTLVLFALGHYFSGNVNAAVQFVGYSTENSDTRCGDTAVDENVGVVTWIKDHLLSHGRRSQHLL